jgi:hypothetical protein
MLRKAITQYAAHLETQSQHHVRFAAVLRSIAHRLRHILADNPPPVEFNEYGYLGEDGKIHILDTLDPSHGTRLYKRKVTEWKELR